MDFPLLASVVHTPVTNIFIVVPRAWGQQEDDAEDFFGLPERLTSDLVSPTAVDTDTMAAQHALSRALGNPSARHPVQSDAHNVIPVRWHPTVWQEQPGNIDLLGVCDFAETPDHEHAPPVKDLVIELVDFKGQDGVAGGGMELRAFPRAKDDGSIEEAVDHGKDFGNSPDAHSHSPHIRLTEERDTLIGGQHL
jgi:hypothetical protein